MPGSNFSAESVLKTIIDGKPEGEAFLKFL